MKLYSVLDPADPIVFSHFIEMVKKVGTRVGFVEQSSLRISRDLDYASAFIALAPLVELKNVWPGTELLSGKMAQVYSCDQVLRVAKLLTTFAKSFSNVTYPTFYEDMHVHCGERLIFFCVSHELDFIFVETEYTRTFIADNIGRLVEEPSDTK